MTEKEILNYKTSMYYDMEFFGRMCFPTAFTMASPQIHFEIYNVLQDDSIKKVLIVVPRGIGKSTMTGLVLPLYKVLFSPIGTIQVILLISKTQGHAIRLLRNIRWHLNNSELIKALWGNWGSDTFIKDTETQIILKDNSMIAALGIGQQVTGYKHGDMRPTLIVPDDIETDENTKTEDRRQSNREWFLGQVEPALDIDGRIAMDATMVHRDCLASNIRADDSWKVIWSGSTLDAEKKEVLWPERFPWKWLQNKRQSFKSQRQEHIYFMQYENTVIGGEDSLFQSTDIQYYEGITECDKYNQVVWLINDEEKIPLKVFIGVDPAKSVAEGRDYTVVMPVGISPLRKRYVLEIWRKRVKPNEIARAIIEVYNRWKDGVARINVEDVLFSGMVADSLKELMESKNDWIPIHKIPVSVGKKDKYQSSISGDFCEKRVFIRKEMAVFEDELISFPRGKHDDTIDAYWLATRSTYPPNEIKYIDKAKREKHFEVKTSDWRGL